MKCSQIDFSISSFYFVSFFYFAANGLSCYECDDCMENLPHLNDFVKECPDKSYVSCLRTESRFAHHTSAFDEIIIDALSYHVDLATVSSFHLNLLVT